MYELTIHAELFLDTCVRITAGDSPTNRMNGWAGGGGGEGHRSTDACTV